MAGLQLDCSRSRSASSNVSIIPSVSSGCLLITLKPFHMYIISCNERKEAVCMCAWVYFLVCVCVCAKLYQHWNGQLEGTGGLIAPGFANSKLLSWRRLPRYLLLKHWHIPEDTRQHERRLKPTGVGSSLLRAVNPLRGVVFPDSSTSGSAQKGRCVSFILPLTNMDLRLTAEQNTTLTKR